VVSFVLELEDKDSLDRVMSRLWKGLGITGEMSAEPLVDGRWRLEVNSEKDLRRSTLEKLRNGKGVRSFGECGPSD